jgi:tetratricopeptide (TPR) repeat protein
MFLFPQLSSAQEKDEEVLDDLGNVTDNFQEFFFEALKQKGIENYDRAIESLEKAAKEKPNEAVVYFEMGKNQYLLKKYAEAEANFKKVIQMAGEKPEVYQAMYDIYYDTSQYTEAIKTVKKLIPFDKDYKEDLANLYERTENYTEALKILEELDQELGTNDYRNQLRQQIYSKSEDTGTQITDLQKRIDKNPVNEQDFLNLIFLHSEEGNSLAAFEVAQNLLKIKPDSELVHLALYKFYLEEKQPEKALQSMKIVFSAEAIDQENKFKVLNDFLLFVNENPTYEDELEEMVSIFSTLQNDTKVYEQLGNYYLKKKMFAEALQYFELGVASNPGDLNLIKNTLLLQIDFKKFKEAESLSKSALDFFPSQPILYLLQGVANIGLNENKKAIMALETGLDYLIDDISMERDFYLQLSIAYQAEGNTAKAQQNAAKAENLVPKN